MARKSRARRRASIPTSIASPSIARSACSSARAWWTSLDLLHVKGDGHFYERRPQRDHMHMTCLRCGKVQEFESDLFDRVKGQVERDCHFHILVARFETRSSGALSGDCRQLLS